MRKIMNRTTVFALFIVAVFGFGGCSKREGNSAMGEPNVRELVKLFQRGAGADDVAGEQFKKMGSRGRDQLISMLDDPSASEEDTGAIVMILHVYFPCQESKKAMERMALRIPDPNEREILVKMAQEMTKDPRYK
jgi:hypothetical protein